MRTLKEVNPLHDFRLECVFEDGSIRIADIKPFLNAEAFKPLLDPEIFSNMLRNNGYYIDWKELEIDLSADTLWHIARPRNGS